MKLKFTRKPYLHFILIGTFLYGAQQFTSSEPTQIVSGPSAESIVEMRQNWENRTGKEPSQKQIDQFIRTEVDNEILYLEAFNREFYLTDGVIRTRLLRDMRFIEPDSEKTADELVEMAIEMNLHENDLVIRGLLIQLMQETAYESLEYTKPTIEELQAQYERHVDEFKTDSLVGFSHVFIDKKLNENPKEKAMQLLGTSFSEEDSDNFPHGLRLRMSDKRLIERKFGSNFSKEIMAAAMKEGKSGKWVGPITSNYGEHLVLVESFRSSKLKPIEKVMRELITYHRRDQEKAALDNLLVELHKQYEVEL